MRAIISISGYYGISTLPSLSDSKENFSCFSARLTDLSGYPRDDIDIVSIPPRLLMMMIFSV